VHQEINVVGAGKRATRWTGFWAARIVHGHGMGVLKRMIAEMFGAPSASR
jgi:hypothetical protein